MTSQFPSHFYHHSTQVVQILSWLYKVTLIRLLFKSENWKNKSEGQSWMLPKRMHSHLLGANIRLALAIIFPVKIICHIEKRTNMNSNPQAIAYIQNRYTTINKRIFYIEFVLWVQFIFDFSKTSCFLWEQSFFSGIYSISHFNHVFSRCFYMALHTPFSPKYCSHGHLTESRTVRIISYYFQRRTEKGNEPYSSNGSSEILVW